MSLRQQKALEREQTKTEREEQLEDDIYLADEIRKFFNSDIGKYLQQRINKDLASIENDLLKVDPYNPHEIVKLQNLHVSIASIKEYFASAMRKGDQALDEIDLKKFNART